MMLNTIHSEAEDLSASLAWSLSAHDAYHAKGTVLMIDFEKALRMAKNCGAEAAANNERRTMTADIWLDIALYAGAENKHDFSTPQKMELIQAFAKGFDDERALADA